MGDRDSEERGGESPVVAMARPRKADPGVSKNRPSGGRVSVMDAESSNGEGVNHGGNMGGVNG